MTVCFQYHDVDLIGLTLGMLRQHTNITSPQVSPALARNTQLKTTDFPGPSPATQLRLLAFYRLLRPFQWAHANRHGPPCLAAATGTAREQRPFRVDLAKLWI